MDLPIKCISMYRLINWPSGSFWYHFKKWFNWKCTDSIKTQVWPSQCGSIGWASTIHQESPVQFPGRLWAGSPGRGVQEAANQWCFSHWFSLYPTLSLSKNKKKHIKNKIKKKKKSLTHNPTLFPMGILVAHGRCSVSQMSNFVAQILLHFLTTSFLPLDQG